ncbi:MAG TPA: hypothetical protein PLE54_11600 [Burkholderiaceae bacterium]|nr:hypothetical protein [Burkholderiaceae bacterium]
MAFYVLSVGGVAVKAYQMGGEHQIATTHEAQVEYEKGRDAALQATAAELAKIDVKQVTIRQRAETITREVPVYTDCRNTPDAMRVLNDALAAPGSQPAGNGVVPAADPAR